MAKKRDFACTNPVFKHFINPNTNSNGWNPKLWNWDCSKFTAKPSELGKTMFLMNREKEDGETLRLEEVGLASSKRARPANCVICQVDDCGLNLLNARDYHRRHKVCETHSKEEKAVVGGKMQRFCQQCSRFHLLAEFDEGKRSCRRRLAGHNRRRRKTQSEDASSNVFVTGSHDGKGNGRMDVVDLLAILSRLQGKRLVHT